MAPENYILLVFVAFMFLILWNRNKKTKAAQEELKNSLTLGANVMLTSGIYGSVVAITDDRITISSGNSTLEVDKRAVARVIPAEPKPEPKTATKPAAKPATKRAPKTTK